MRERIQEFVLPLSPTLHAQPSGRQLSLLFRFLSEALSTKEDVIAREDGGQHIHNVQQTVHTSLMHTGPG